MQRYLRNLRRTKSKGREFVKAPKEEFYGTEALFKDDSGNWFSLQPKSNSTQAK